jgi:hypothetical protein
MYISTHVLAVGSGCDDVDVVVIVVVVAVVGDVDCSRCELLQTMAPLPLLPLLLPPAATGDHIADNYDCWHLLRNLVFLCRAAVQSKVKCTSKMVR